MKGTARPLYPHTSQLHQQAQRAGSKAAAGVRDQSRMAALRDEARGAARVPDGGTPGRKNDAIRILCCPLAVCTRLEKPVVASLNVDQPSWVLESTEHVAEIHNGRIHVK